MSKDYLSQILKGPVDQVAMRLLGCSIVRSLNGEEIVGKIVETEAYDQTDRSSHSFRGPTKRTEIMFGESGYAYVYFTYGMHYCMNVVTGEKGHGSAVLIRSLEPITGTEMMRLNRPGIDEIHNLTNGPAKLCQALAINKDFNGHNLRKPPLRLMIKPPLDIEQIVVTKRIGISHEVDSLLRFYIKDNSYISRQ